MKTCVLSPRVLYLVSGAALLYFLSSLAIAQAPNAPASNAAISAQQGTEQALAKSAQAQTSETPAGGTDFPLVRTIGGFALVISLILIAFLVARKIAPQYFNKCSVEKNLKLIESMSMGEKRSIALIQVRDRRFLIGNTPHQITLLSQLEDSFSLVSETEKARSTAPTPKNLVDPFRKLYEAERNRDVAKLGRDKAIPPDVRAKMRQLREALEG